MFVAYPLVGIETLLELVVTLHGAVRKLTNYALLERQKSLASFKTDIDSPPKI